MAPRGLTARQYATLQNAGLLDDDEQQGSGDQGNGQQGSGDQQDAQGVSLVVPLDDRSTIQTSDGSRLTVDEWIRAQAGRSTTTLDALRPTRQRRQRPPTSGSGAAS